MNRATTLTPDQKALVVNALREKAAGDTEAADDGTNGLFPAEVGVLNTATVRLAATLREQARVANELADEIENANDVKVTP